MVRKMLTKEDAISAVYGGCILGGGGGGWIADGLEKTDLAFALGNPELITVDELQDNEFVPCVSLVGAPSAKEMYVDSDQLVNTIHRMKMEFDKPIAALMTNENGASTTINGWLQAAATGLPVVDAPSNGRAHPTGSMGSMNLSEVADYQSIQTFAGGKGDKEAAGSITGTLDLTSSAVRSISVQAGGMVGVCRNPVDTQYIKENAAVGAITQAIELGNEFLSVPEGPERIEKAVTYLKGRIIHSGKVNEFQLDKTGGFDVGYVRIDDLELTFWNEYMTAEKNGERKGTFPDLIMTFDVETGKPLVSAEIKEGIKIAVMSVPKENLLLSSTMYNQKLLKTVEPIINKSII
ncbi:hypothetical protein J18TS1_08170 [Oceanobacillus oncorhynchi subsp. incaldanensis]|uniref:OsrF n=2 Tax=Oceanobacillus TaxID=182709 RepID=A0A0A1MTU4_9BACI|nr:DUF917 family protein [Oceanobacillus oncorhynchi]MDM8102306.1 DUF917 family protein [Oceanobacillus oncorhynchi]UUI41575.1 DUF917 family protein [Oceanobacillus oncorhynchi]GIO17717.1 hypothetical protein J18TS1_08170 [Oceanobacillus oncorhynchi subsp. incaldanensis]CEI83099.1 hypothetical protein BN997_02989 [Oceanobacillus oncorhynchi]